MLPLPRQRYGLAEELLVPALGATKRCSLVGAGFDAPAAPPPSPLLLVQQRSPIGGRARGRYTRQHRWFWSWWRWVPPRRRSPVPTDELVAVPRLPCVASSRLLRPRVAVLFGGLLVAVFLV